MNRCYLLIILLAFFWLPALIMAVEVDLEAGLFSNSNRYKGELDTGNPYSDEDLRHVRTRAFIGLNLRKEMKPGIHLGAKLLYNHRDFIERPSDLYSRGRYLDMMLHPSFRDRSLEIYGGPTLAVKLASEHNGGNNYDQEEAEDFAPVVPGIHFGARYPATGSRISLDLCINMDLLPFSDGLGVDKYQQKVMFGLNYNLYGGRAYDSLRNDSPLLRLAHADRKECNIRPGLSFTAVNDWGFLDFKAALEYKQYFDQVAWGIDVGLMQIIGKGVNQYTEEESFSFISSRISLGPQFSVRFGKLEPFVRLAGGVGFVRVVSDEDIEAGLMISFHADTGLRYHLSKTLALDLAASRMWIGLKDVGWMPYLGVSLINIFSQR